MAQLTETLARELKTNERLNEEVLKNLSERGRVTCSIQLQEEEGEVLITLLMTQEQIKEAVNEAVRQVFGAEVFVSFISTCCEGHFVNFTIFQRL